ncbi:MAG: TIGR02206 family membrane protein [Fidelibacterota bacterium]
MKRPFVLFGLEHATAVAVVIALIAAAILQLKKHNSQAHKRQVHIWLAALILVREAGARALPFLRNEFSLSEDLPFHLCRVTQYLMVLYLLRPRQKLFDVLFYWIVGGSSLALMFPDLDARFPSVDSLLYWSSHGLPLFAVLYLVSVQGKRPSPGSFRSSFLFLNLFAMLVVLPADLLSGGNYLYLFEVPSVDFEPIGWLPPWPWYLLVLEVFFLGWFRLLYSPFVRHTKQREAEKLA